MQDLEDMLIPQVREILNAINSGVYLTDKDRRIVYWNRRAEEITGYAAEDVVGLCCREGILEHEDRSGRRLCQRRFCPLYRTITKNKESDAPVVVYAKTANGDRIPLSTMTAPLHDAEGNVIGGIEIFRDESEALQEMTLARASLGQMLDRDVPTNDHISFLVEYSSAEMIGGDYYRLEEREDGSFFLFLADVAGHGVSAALYIALIHSLVRECGDRTADPAAFLTGLNERLVSRAPEVGFVTALCVNFRPDRHEALHASAGHPPAFLQKEGQADVELIEHKHDFPLGLSDAGEYTNELLRLAPGDRFLAYTDGASDVRIAEEERIGTSGLVSLLQAHPPAGGDHRLAEFYEALLDRCQTHMPEDDITLISCLAL